MAHRAPRANLPAGGGRSLAWIGVVLVCLTLVACGFQLRGAGELPPEMARTAISGISEQDALARDLAQSLRANGVRVVERDEADALLRITRMDTGRRTLSVGGDARVSEYEVYLTIGFQVEGLGSEFEIPTQTLTLTRDYLFDPAGVLGRSEQERVLRESMRRDAVQLILLRLQSAAR
ncbi:LPS assembly lipoprotein LptE [Ectothiorhodospira variabilis]|uniref:LPS-assembly lipoprotein LptE n=1 Tax=Ectothiorhodospira variabilis TaxID=505694 RepID=UPI001EFBC997|nr:LPS assembly lipoprotein LptE [Ectothiorhodospira variabilis]MCG5495719.1 LPS assembly lipoprotein LptE [Ectothiorhodospira variabilis]MCG5498655.1 LPS assembly lipoprotein LptE [Ectothiorhodospira variabilis]MCG5503265.1 LPS assembly lipoprotein LptE [Ectothiorhodospira variabilis]MCG5505976.1 LPS assembly lipoprotein LptE [Ectothiorhodospira variabilis]